MSAVIAESRVDTSTDVEAVLNYTRNTGVRPVNYPEVEAALKAHTGADKVILFDHTLRDSTAEPGQAALREPVRRVHDDQTLHSAPNRVFW
jgi:hypothetical protein